MLRGKWMRMVVKAQELSVVSVRFVALRAGAMIALTIFAGLIESPFYAAQAQAPSTNVPSLVVNHACRGACGSFTSWSVQFREDGTVEYRTTKSGDTKESDQVITKRGLVTAREAAELTKLVSSPAFLKANTDYDSGVSFIDMLVTTTLVYNDKSSRKEIHIRNYVPRPNRADAEPPSELARILEITNEVIERIQTR